MPTLIERLESLNRKERFFVVGAALGNPRFRLDQKFRAKLGCVFDLDVPDDAFAAMDYHFDWIHAALHLTGRATEAIHSNEPMIVTGTQEDVDLLVAFEDEGTTHLLLIEAKAETGWTNKQLLSKAKRLRQIFGADGSRYCYVTPHFALWSPRPPQELASYRWPVWMTRDGKPIWFELCVPEGVSRVTRCDSDGKQSSKDGFFRIIRKRGS